MTMRPLDQAERADLAERLGEEVMRRLDALVVAGYALHAVGVDDPAADPLRWCETAGYLLDGQDPGEQDDALAGLALRLVDKEGDCWAKLDEGDRWTSAQPGTASHVAYSRDELERRWGPVREVWVR